MPLPGLMLKISYRLLNKDQMPPCLRTLNSNLHDALSQVRPALWLKRVINLMFHRAGLSHNMVLPSNARPVLVCKGNPNNVVRC